LYLPHFRWKLFYNILCIFITLTLIVLYANITCHLSSINSLEASLLRTPTASFSHRHLSQRCSSQIVPEPSPIDHSVFYFMFFFVSLYFVSFVLFFVLIFLYILFCWVSLYLVFLCIALFYLFCVFFYFCSSADLLYVCFVVLHPLSGLFLRPHRVELLQRPLVYGVYLHVISFISLYFYYFCL
jgi:hypothetical protein